LSAASGTSPSVVAVLHRASLRLTGAPSRLHLGLQEGRKSVNIHGPDWLEFFRATASSILALAACRAPPFPASLTYAIKEQPYATGGSLAMPSAELVTNSVGALLIPVLFRRQRFPVLGGEISTFRRLLGGGEAGALAARGVMRALVCSRS
jgi:hypothetical protein